MHFTLNKTTLSLIQNSTGVSPKEQSRTSMSRQLSGMNKKRSKEYLCPIIRSIHPRGSVYIQAGRFLHMEDVHRYLSKLKNESKLFHFIFRL